MTENKEGNKNKFPKIRPPSKIAIQKATADYVMENPDIQKLIEEGKGVFVNSDTGEVKIIEEQKKKNEKP